MQLHMFEYDVTGLTAVLNQGLGIFLNNMHNEKVIDDAMFEKLSRYSLVVSRKGVFGRVLEKFFKKEDDYMTSVVLHIQPPQEKECQAPGK